VSIAISALNVEKKKEEGRMSETKNIPLAYKVISKDHILDMSFLAPFKDKDCEIIILENKGLMTVPFPRMIHSQEHIEKYNARMKEGEEYDSVPEGTYGRMDVNRYLITTPIENGEVWVIIDSDDLKR
jgi:hypothetical protein